jgi:hypothetical protein
MPALVFELHLPRSNVIDPLLGGTRCEASMNKLFEIIYESIFGCHHANLSRVFTIKKHTYCVCCDCGRSFDYSLETMSIRRTHGADNALPSTPHPKAI